MLKEYPPPNGYLNHSPTASSTLNSADTYRRTKLTTHHTPSNEDIRPMPANDMHSLSTNLSLKENKFFGLNMKYLSLITLALQNAGLSIIMHYSRVSTSPSRAYSAASAVLLNEIFKGSISFAVALSRTPDPYLHLHENPYMREPSHERIFIRPDFNSLLRRSKAVWREIFSSDCWKLSIPAILYVIQNNLQYTASANLDIVIFQVSYQMKILTTAAFSVFLLGKRLSVLEWLALLLLAIGVGIVQIQSSSPGADLPHHDSRVSEHERLQHHVMQPFKGLAAVLMACITSGLAGVYFEMVLKRSKADLWIRNIQLSLFSILPALAPIIWSTSSISGMFDHFGMWAWATVLTQVCGGLITGLVIKYSDNILKAFATSLSIILSFIVSVYLFDFHITLAFVLGSSTVLFATWMYNQSQEQTRRANILAKQRSFPGSPVPSDAPILGQLSVKKNASLVDLSPRAIAASLGLSSSSEDLTSLPPKITGQGYSVPNGSSLSARSPYVASRTPSASRSHSPVPKDEHIQLR